MLAERQHQDWRAKLANPLVDLAEHVDFEVRAARGDAAVPRPSRPKGSRSPYKMVLVLKILILQQLYKLADDT